MKQVTIIGSFREVSDQIEAYDLKGYKIVRSSFIRGKNGERDTWIYVMEGK